MAKPKKKPVDLWPPFDGQIPKALYDEALKKFTKDNIEASREALNPDPDFDLTGRLRRAVFHYFWFKAGRQGDNAALSDLMPKGVQKKELADLIKAASALLSICEKTGFIANIVKEYNDQDGLSAAWNFSQGLAADLKFLKQTAEATREKFETGSGNKEDIARRVFCAHLLMIYEDVTGRRATTTKAGSSHNFFSVGCSAFINSEISDESTLNYLKDAISKRDAIKSSPLFK